MDSKYAVVQSSGAHNFYWVSIVHTILPSLTQQDLEYKSEAESDDEDEFEVGEFE
jgi:hypothetical protein